MNGTTTSAAPPSPADRATAGGATGFRRSLSALSFWCSIALPAVYLPLLAAGIESTGGLAAFLGLLGLHVLSLVGGRDYRPR